MSDYKSKSELDFEREVIDYLTHIGGVKQWEYLENVKTTEQLWNNFKLILEQNNRARLKKTLTVTEFNQVKKIISNIDTPYHAGQFLYGVNTVSKAVSNKTTMDILQCILIEAYDDCIKLTANDTELGIETVIQGTIIEPGKIALEAKIFSEIIKKIPDPESTSSQKNIVRCIKLFFFLFARTAYQVCNSGT